MKTLVNIFDSQEPLAAYLFLKQYYEEGDRLLFISTRGDRQAVAPYASLFQLPDDLIDVVSFKRDEDSYIYDRICHRLRSRLAEGTDYWVNLAGGTRYSALAVQHVFAAFGARFFYVQTRENLIVSSFFDNATDPQDDIIEPIRYRMSLAEYFQLHNLEHDLFTTRHMPIRGKDDAQRIFDCFRTRRLSSRAFHAIEQLRLQYRGTKQPLEIHEVKVGSAHRRDAVPGIEELLSQFGFIPKKDGMLQPDEVDYLTGGWFEEYVFHLLLRALSPQEIALSVRINRPGSKHDNELDVVFIKANTLFVVECKTGIATDHLFNEIVYKSCALKEAFLGMKCYSYIFTLKNDYDHRLQRVSDMMGVTLCPKGTLTDEKLMLDVYKAMIKQSYEFD